MKKLLIRTLGIAILLAAAWASYRFVKQLPQRQEAVATTKVRKGDVIIRAYSRGELRAVRSVTLSAPNLFGTVQVTRLAPVGALSKEKDLIIEFDDSERRAALEETLLEVEQYDEQIKRAQADNAIRANQDDVDLLKARYAVRRAELEVKRNPIISAIDAKKNLLTLDEQRRRLKQLESDVLSRREQAKATVAVLQEQRNKSMIDVENEKRRIASAKVLSPMAGLVAIKQNRSGFFMFGQQIPDIREGDTLQPGMPVADILDLSELEVLAKIGELDRANLREGQEVSLALDAVPSKRFRGSIKSLSGTASSNVFSGDPSKKFDVVFSIDMRQLLAGLGVKPPEVEKIMATAERNAKKPAIAPPPPPEGSADIIRVNAPAGGAAPAQAAPAQPRPAVAAPAAGQPQSSPVPGGNPLDLLKIANLAAQQFSDEDRAKANLPPPPEEDSQLNVLLRPGLLADIEITVEKIPNALHVPAQAIFEKNGKQVVFVQQGKKFEERPIQLLKRSESTMVLSGGVKPGETIALADPTVKKSGKKGEKKDSNAMGAVPGGAQK
ncbi:MAG: efflux RND transporter periplasmic adaptor subunit [Bryobacteraceae bacterium]